MKIFNFRLLKDAKLRILTKKLKTFFLYIDVLRLYLPQAFHLVRLSKLARAALKDVRLCNGNFEMRLRNSGWYAKKAQRNLENSRKFAMGYPENWSRVFSRQFRISCSGRPALFFHLRHMCQFGTQAFKAMCQMKILRAKFLMCDNLHHQFLRILAYSSIFRILYSGKNLSVISLRRKNTLNLFKIKENNGKFRYSFVF